jgi:hypothetical protein
MNWYNKSQSTVLKPTLNAKDLVRGKNTRSQSVPQNNSPPTIEPLEPAFQDDDAESG